MTRHSLLFAENPGDGEEIFVLFAWNVENYFAVRCTPKARRRGGKRKTQVQGTLMYASSHKIMWDIVLSLSLPPSSCWNGVCLPSTHQKWMGSWWSVLKDNRYPRVNSDGSRKKCLRCCVENVGKWNERVPRRERCRNWKTVAWRQLLGYWLILVFKSFQLIFFSSLYWKKRFGRGSRFKIWNFVMTVLIVSSKYQV